MAAAAIRWTQEGARRLWRAVREARLGRHAWRLLVSAIAAVCLFSTGAAIAYYTGSGPAGAKRSAPANPLLRYADATDAWLESLRKPSFWKGRSSGRGSSGGGSARGRRTEPQSSRRMRSRGTESQETGTSRRARSATRPRDREEWISPAPVIERSDRAVRRAIREPKGSSAYEVYDTTPVTRSQSTSTYYNAPVQWSATYRTMCVRLCDGYYWPVSFTATKADFARDSDVCQQSCDAPAALYTYKNPGEEAESMVDLQGRPYIELENAFLYRASYDASCKCRAHPWEDASRRRHMSYKLADQVPGRAARKR